MFYNILPFKCYKLDLIYNIAVFGSTGVSLASPARVALLGRGVTRRVMDTNSHVDGCVRLLEGDVVLRGGYLATPDARCGSLFVQHRLSGRPPRRMFLQVTRKCHALRQWLFPPGDRGDLHFDCLVHRLGAARDLMLEESMEQLRWGTHGDTVLEEALEEVLEDCAEHDGTHGDTSTSSPGVVVCRPLHGHDNPVLRQQVAPIGLLSLPVYGKAWMFNVLLHRTARTQGQQGVVCPWMEVTPGNMLLLKLACAEAMGLAVPSVGTHLRGSSRRRWKVRGPWHRIRSGLQRGSFLGVGRLATRSPFVVTPMWLLESLVPWPFDATAVRVSDEDEVMGDAPLRAAHNETYRRIAFRMGLYGYVRGWRGEPMRVCE